MAAPEIGELLDSHGWMHEPLRYRFPHCVRRRIEHARLPEGYAVIGDAISSFDPTFGQGMSVAGMEAVALCRCLGRSPGPDGLSTALTDDHRVAVGDVDRAWAIVESTIPHVDGAAGDGRRGRAAVAAYAHQVQLAAEHDERVARSLLRVTNLMDPAAALMRPGVAVRVVLAMLASGAARRGARGRAAVRA